ncbi:MFS transporter [Actinomyces gerencseriae]|uniref:MFS transporter n=1 Tax=Actinomyces gerencseriae TaxID=52769 RepID=UPI0023F0FAF4|nr:MFS transporter [Actinomyces gerencseriae]
MTFTTTRRAAYASFVVQAIVNNLAPLLFVVFHARLGIDVARLGLLAGLNFLVQLLTDLAAVKVVDRVGYRAPMVLAHALAALGLVLMALLPQLLASPFAGLCLAAVVYAIGGGLIEVLASPVVEHLPAEPGRSKESGMALLHSFYCWGQLSVVVASTALLTILGMGAWWVLPLVWAAVPAVNAVLMTRVPVPATVPDHERTSLIGLVGSPVFLLVLLLMAAGGASELTMSQWSSFFAQQATGVPKAVGDLLGPGLFALLMALGRTAYGLLGERVPLRGALIASGAGAAACYVVTASSPAPAASLVACALTGLCVALMWPGATSLAAARFPAGGGAMFAMLALAGDVGAAAGPSAAGAIADAAGTASAGAPGRLAALLPPDAGTGLRPALLVCCLVPVVFAVSVWTVGRFSDTACSPASD